MLILRPKLLLRFNPHAWGDEDVLSTTNCYSYALDEPELGPVQPGGLQQKRRIFEASPQKLDIALTKLDGLQRLSRQEALSGKFHTLALSIGRLGFHFYRHDVVDGTWSHKPGKQPITKFDDDKKEIVDPERANVEAYDQFVGYYAVPTDGLIYEPTTGLCMRH